MLVGDAVGLRYRIEAHPCLQAHIRKAKAVLIKMKGGEKKGKQGKLPHGDNFNVWPIF